MVSLHGQPSLEPRLSVLDFASQLWRKICFSPKLRQNSAWKTWVQGYGQPVKLSMTLGTNCVIHCKEQDDTPVTLVSCN